MNRPAPHDRLPAELVELERRLMAQSDAALASSAPPSTAFREQVLAAVAAELAGPTSPRATPASPPQQLSQPLRRGGAASGFQPTAGVAAALVASLLFLALLSPRLTAVRQLAGLDGRSPLSLTARARAAGVPLEISSERSADRPSAGSASGSSNAASAERFPVRRLDFRHLLSGDL